MPYPTIDKCFSCSYADGYGCCMWIEQDGQKAPCEGGKEEDNGEVD